MKLTLPVFYADFGMYRSALAAAEALGAERPELEVILETAYERR